MNTLNKLRTALVTRYLVNTKHCLVVLAPSIGPLRSGTWYATLVPGGGIGCALPLTRRTHLIIGAVL